MFVDRCARLRTGSLRFLLSTSRAPDMSRRAASGLERHPAPWVAGHEPPARALNHDARRSVASASMERCASALANSTPMRRIKEVIGWLTKRCAVRRLAAASCLFGHFAVTEPIEQPRTQANGVLRGPGVSGVLPASSYGGRRPRPRGPYSLACSSRVLAAFAEIMPSSFSEASASKTPLLSLARSSSTSSK